MDAKTLKKDLIYALKTFQKGGKILKVRAEEMECVDGKYQLVADEYDPFQALTLIKGWAPAPEYLSYLASMERTSKAHEEFLKYIQQHSMLMFDSDQSRLEHLSKAPNVPPVDAPLGYMEWSYLSALLERETSIKIDSWYSFMNGFENVYQYPIDEFYEMGVYMREKFLPIDARKEMLKPKVFIPVDTNPMIRKFVVQTRGELAILEVEGQEIRDILPPHSISFKIFSPQSLWEKKPSGEMVPTTWRDHAIYASVDDALESCDRMIRHGFEFQLRKGRITSYTEDEIQAKLAEIKTIML